MATMVKINFVRRENLEGLADSVEAKNGLLRERICEAKALPGGAAWGRSKGVCSDCPSIVGRGKWKI